MSVNDNEELKLVFDDNSELFISKNNIIEISPTFYYKNINHREDNAITIPKNIGYNDMDNFIKIFQKYLSRLRQFNYDEYFISIKYILEGYSTNISKLIQISEFFENNSFSIILIRDCLLADNNKDNETINSNHSMNIDNAVLLLYLSYTKLKEITNINKAYFLHKNNNIEEECESTWLDLFIKSLDMIGKNLNYYFKNDNNDNYVNNRLLNFDKKIIDEIYEKYSFNLIMNNYLINKHETELSDLNKKCINIKELNTIINFLIQKRNQNDFFSLLSNEFMKIISEENINEISCLPNPTFTLKININDIDNCYEEYPINNSFNMNETSKLIITVYYKKNEDTFNVALKLSKDKNDKTKSSFDILTFLSLALVEEINTKQINVKSLSNNKSMYEILKISNFKKIISTNNKGNNIKKNDISLMNEYLTLKIFLKPCFIYTMLTNYLFYDLENLYENKNISKLSKNLLNLIIQRKQLVKTEDKNMENDKDMNNNINNISDKLVICLMNWLDDEINICEDISEMIKSIQWEYVSLPLIFEFLIKYSIHIISDDFEYIFSKSLSTILSKFNGNLNLLSQEIIRSIIISSKKMNYISMFRENKKIKKFNLYELMNQRRNISDLINNSKKNNNNDIENNNNNIINNYNNDNEKNNQNENIIKSQNKFICKDGSFYNNKDSENNFKKKIKLGNNLNHLNNNKYLNSSKNKNSSFAHNNSIYYNNYFTNCNNNFNINIKFNDKLKKDNSYEDKKKVIISKIKSNNNNNNNNMQCLKKKNTTPNKLINTNNSLFSNQKMNNKLDKFSPNNYLNKTINLKNLKNFDKMLMKDKNNKSRNKSNIIGYNHSEIKNNIFINEGYSNLNFKKQYQSKNKRNIDNNYMKKNKHIKHISLLNDFLHLSKKEKTLNNIPNKRNLRNNNQTLDSNHLNLTQINQFEK